MKKCAKINLCIIGSTNFGKSSIAASLIHVAATTDGGIHLLGSPTQVLKMADDLKANGQHVATGWDDIAKFKFLLNGSDGRSWQISLRDYPGALFTKYVEHPTLMSRVKGLFAGQTTSSHDEYTFDKTAEKKAIQLIAELERADALIVLVPADVSDAKYGNDRAIYKQKLPEFIEAVMRHRPNIPVCLCINKWDMFDCGIEKLEDKLIEYPFCDFYRSLQLVCGDNLSIAAVSAFGHHDPNDREKIDPNQEQKPLNILETLLPLAEKAEKARFERTVDVWKQSNWIKKTLVFPFRTASLLAARYTDKHIRNGLLKMAAKAWGLFAAFVLTVAVILSAATTVAYWAKEEVGFRNLEKSFDDYESKPYLADVKKLDAAHENLEASNIVRKMFFNSRIQNLKMRFKNIEGCYNDRVLGDAKAYCDDANNKDIPPSEKGDPEERKKRAARRKKRLVAIMPEEKPTDRAMPKDELPKLTTRASSQKNELKKLIKSEDELLQNIENNYPLYREAYELFHDSDRKNVCRRIRRFVDAQKGAHPECQALFAELEGCLDKTEKSIAEELERKTTECKNSNPPKTAAEQAELDRKLIDLITAYESQFVENSENFKPFAKMRENLIADEGDQNKYGPFDTEYNRLAALDRTGKLREIKKFKDKYSYDKFPKRKKKFGALDDLSRELLDYIAGEVKKAETDNRDNDKLFAQQRIDRATALKNKYEWAAGEYIQDSDEQREVLRKRSEKQSLIADLQKYKMFDEEYSKLDKNNLRAVSAFLSKFTVNAYSRPEYVAKIKELELVRDARIKEIDKRLKAELKDDNKSIAASERIKLCQECINALNRALKKYVEGSNEFHDTEMRLEAQKVFLETLRGYEKFEIEVSALLGSDENGKLRRIAEFLQNHPKDRYKDVYHQKLFKQLEEAQTTLLESIKKTRDRALTDNREDLTMPAKTIVQRAKARKDAYDIAKGEFIVGTVEWKEADQGARDAEAQRAEWEPYIQFEKDYKDAKDAPVNTRLIKIHKFLRDYNPQVFARRKEFFTNLGKCKAETEVQIKNELDAKLKTINEPAMQDIPGWIKYSEAKKNLFLKYREYYPQSSKEYQSLDGDWKITDAEWRKYTNWLLLCEDVASIKKAKEESKSDPRVLMPLIKAFWKKFPKGDYSDSRLKNSFDCVTTIQQEAEAKLVKELNGILEEQFPLDGTNEKELQDHLRERCNKIREFLPYFGKDNYDLYVSHFQEYSTRLTEEESRTVFNSALKDLYKFLRSDADAGNKEERIDGFLKIYDAWRSKSPQIFADLTIERGKWHRVKRWKQKRTEIECYLAQPLDDSSTKALVGDKNKCETFLNDLSSHTDTIIEGEVKDIRGKLINRKKSIEKQIGDGTYADIQDKEKKYMDDPSEKKYRILCSAIEGFDTESPENQLHKDKVEAIKKNSSNYHDAQRYYEEFLKTPNHATWASFGTCVAEIDNKYPKNYSNIYNKIRLFMGDSQNRPTVTVGLWYWNFRGTKFWKYGDVDCDVYINRGSDGNGDLYCYDIWGGRWHAPDVSYKQNTERCLYKKVEFNKAANIEIIFANTDGNNVYSHTHTITVYELVVKGREKGECIYPIEDNPGGGYIELRFTGLPRF